MNDPSNDLYNDPASSVLPRQIGPYFVECLIERGTLHESYRGFDPIKKIPVFIKRLTQNALQVSPQARENFSREVRLLRTINHPHIMRLIQAGMESGRPYLVCEYLEGVSLRDFLIYELPRPSEAFYILRQVAAALGYLHARHIIHNDLKPENIRISPLLHATLIDFSISQSLERSEDIKIRQLAGTLLYMSPEQQTQKELSAASDLYSFAIIAYELICGHLSHGVIQLAQLPQPLQLIFSKALQNDPKQRFKSVNEFFLALEEAKDCVAGLHLPIRRNIESDILIDFNDWTWPVVDDERTNRADLIFVRASSFQGERSLVARRSHASRSTTVFIDAIDHRPSWLYYLKAQLDNLGNEYWNLKDLQQFLDNSIKSLKVEPMPSLAIVQLTTDGSSTFRVSLDLALRSGMMCALVEAGHITRYEETAGPWGYLNYCPQSSAQFFLFARSGANARQLGALIDSICNLCANNFSATCNVASRRLGDYLANWQQLHSSTKIDIKTLRNCIALLGIEIQNG